MFLQKTCPYFFHGASFKQLDSKLIQCKQALNVTAYLIPQTWK